MRVHKLALETTIQEEIEVDHCAVAWLVENAADVINKVLISQDGNCAYERVKGRTYKGDTLEFATPVLHRVSGKVHGGVMAERWHEGIWLGTCMKANERFVGLSEGGVVRARAVKERPSSMQVTRDELDRITQGPWESTGVILEGVRRGEGRKGAVPEEKPQG